MTQTRPPNPERENRGNLPRNSGGIKAVATAPITAALTEAGHMMVEEAPPIFEADPSMIQKPNDCQSYGNDNPRDVLEQGSDPFAFVPLILTDRVFIVFNFWKFLPMHDHSFLTLISYR